MKKLLKELSSEEIKQIIKETIQDTAVEKVLEDEDLAIAPEPDPEGDDPESDIPKWERVIITPSMQKVFVRYGVLIPGQDKPYLKKIDIFFPFTVLADLDSRTSRLKSELQILPVKTAPVISQIRKRLYLDRKRAVKGGQVYSVLECVRGTNGNLVFRRVV